MPFGAAARNAGAAITEAGAVRTFLAAHGIDYERWTPDRPVGADADADTVLAAYGREIETLKAAPPDRRELDRALNQIETSFYSRMERVGGFAGKADQLNAYYAATGNPDYFAEDLARYRSLTPSDIQAIARRFLPADRRVELVVVPEGTGNGQQ